MQILTYKEINRAAWSRLVAASATGTWFQGPEAYEFYASMPELFRPFVVGLENEGKLRGVCVGYVTVEKSVLKQMMTRRAIIVGGPVLADVCSEEEVETLMMAVRNQFKILDFRLKILNAPIYIECRNFNDYSRWKEAFEKAGFEYVPHLNFHVDTSSVEVVESNLGKSRKRDIRTSLRDGATIIEKPTLEQVREYYAILENLYKTRVKTPLFPFSFFEKLWQHKDGRFILVALNNEIIGGTVCVVFNRDKFETINHKFETTTHPSVVYEWFVCGRDGEWKSIFPSSLATYAGIKYAAEHGCARFDMMGAGTPNEAYGVRDFKARFGGKEVEHGRFLCITKPLLYRLGVLGVKILKKLK
jgi:hypothetical protein